MIQTDKGHSLKMPLGNVWGEGCRPGRSLADGKIPPQANVLRRCADQDPERAWFDDPVHLGIEEPELLRTKSKSQLAILSRGEMDALKAFERDQRLSDRSEEVADIELDDLIASAGSCVLHATTEGRGGTWRDRGGLDREGGVVEGGVAETITEGKEQVAP